MSTSEPPTNTSSWRTFLAKVTVSSLVDTTQQLDYVKSNASIAEVVASLTHYRVTSAPVWDDKNNIFIGMVDMSDILYFFLSKVPEQELASELRGQDSLKTFYKEEIGKCIDFSKRNPWCPVYLEKPLLSLMDMFGKQVHLHRIPVIDGEGKVLSVVSQSKVVEFLDLTLRDYSVVKRTVRELFPLTTKILSVGSKEPVLAAFQLLQESKVSGIAVVDEEGVLVGNISPSDMKVLDLANLVDSLLLPIGLFLERTAEFFERPMRGIYCKPNDSLRQVLQILTQEKLHRLYVVEDSKSLVGVISLTDIIDCLDHLGETSTDA